MNQWLLPPPGPAQAGVPISCGSSRIFTWSVMPRQAPGAWPLRRCQRARRRADGTTRNRLMVGRLGAEAAARCHAEPEVLCRSAGM